MELRLRVFDLAVLRTLSVNRRAASPLGLLLSAGMHDGAILWDDRTAAPIRSAPSIGLAKDGRQLVVL
jgi:hypothetical protein